MTAAPGIGLVGFGRWGRLIFRDLRALGADVHVAVTSEASRQAALEQGAAGVCSSASELPPLDGYGVAVPTVLHAAAVRDLIGTGRPIFVEKPMTDDADAAARLAEEAGERIFVMDKWRYHPGVEEIGRRVRAGEIGAVRSVQSYRQGWGNPHRDVDAIWILLPHDLSMVFEVLGFLPQARAAIDPTGRASGNGIVAVLADDDAGLVVTMDVSAEHPIARRSLVVTGETGSLQLGDSYDDRIVLRRPGDAAPVEIAVSTDMPLRRELAAFVDHLRGGPPPRTAARDAAEIVLRIAELRRMAGLS